RTSLLLVGGVLLGATLQAIDGSVVNVAVPRIEQELHASLAQVSWAVTGYVLSSLVAMPLCAALARRLGMRAYFIGSVALFTLASAACGLSRSVEALIVFRVLQGLGAGGLLPTSQAILMALFGEGQRARAIALVGLASVVGPLVGPPLGGVLTDWLG